jgi:DNA-binding HxlR family transcriptional regulator
LVFQRFSGFGISFPIPSVEGIASAQRENERGTTVSLEEESPVCRHYRVAADMLGKRWTPQILRGLLSGVTRYTDLKEGVAPISDALLSDRLKELEALGIVRREVTPSTPVRISYGLTTKGEDLAGVIGELADWAERWAEEPATR